MIRPSILFLALSAAAGASPAYRIVAHQPIGGEGGYDHLRVDPVARRVYSSHEDRVEVTDADSGRKLGVIAPTRGVHDIALAPEFNRGFITCPVDREVLAFNLKTLAPETHIRIPESKKVDVVEYDPFSKRAYALDGTSGNIFVIDAAASKVVGTIPLGGVGGVAFDASHLYVTGEDANVIHVIDSKTLQPIAHYPVAPGKKPGAIGIDPKRRMLWASCANGLAVRLPCDGGTVASGPIGSQPDALCVDSERARVFISCKDGTLDVFAIGDGAELGRPEVVATQRGGGTDAEDTATGRVYVAVSKLGPVPAATPQSPRPRAPVVPDTFELLVIGE